MNQTSINDEEFYKRFAYDNPETNAPLDDEAFYKQFEYEPETRQNTQKSPTNETIENVSENVQSLAGTKDLWDTLQNITLSDGKNFTEAYNRMTDEQKAVVNAGEGVWAVLAGPGSGKTATMTARVAKLVRDGVPPERICMVTFTNKSAAEMLKRAKHLEPACEGVFSGTFHSLALSILRNKEFGNEFRWHIVEPDGLAFAYASHALDTLCENKDNLFGQYKEQDLAKQLEEVQKKYGLTLDMLKDFYETIEKGLPKGGLEIAKNELAEKIGKKNKTLDASTFHTIESQLCKAYASFGAYKEKKFILSLDDIVPQACKLLREREDLRSYFQYVTVDEYQDTNKDQYEFSQLLSEGYGNLLCVGDDKQSIYGWRGADVDNFMCIVQEAAENTLRLSTNFRSCQSIVGLTNNSQSLIQNKLDTSDMVAFSQSTAMQSHPGVFSNAREQAEKIVEKLIQAHMQGVPWSETAVLVRSHRSQYASTNLIQAACLRKNIPIRLVGANIMSDAAETKYTLSFMRLAKNLHDSYAWMTILQSFPMIKEVKAIKLSNKLYQAQNFSEIKEILQKELHEPKDEAKRQDFLAVRTAIFDALETIEHSLPLPEKDQMQTIISVCDNLLSQKTIMNRILFHSAKKTEEEINKRMHTKQLLIDGLTDVADKAETIDDFLNTFQLASPDDKQDERDCVTISTIHSAKGLEWDTVFIPDLIQGQFPTHRVLKLMQDEDPEKREAGYKAYDEEARLFYVAISRAKKHVFFSFPLGRDEFTSYMPSPYICHIAGVMGCRQGYIKNFNDFEKVSFTDEPVSSLLSPEQYMKLWARECGIQEETNRPEEQEEQIEALAAQLSAIPF